MRAMSAAARYCTTRQLNGHGTGVERKLCYPWHPWAGLKVHVHEVIEKGDVAVFRCSLSGQVSGRWLEVPAWMFERSASVSWCVATASQVELAALGALAELLQDSHPIASIQVVAGNGSVPSLRIAR